MTTLPMRCPDCAGCALYEEHVGGQTEPVAYAGVTLDARRRSIRYEGREIGIAPTHTRILAALLRTPERVVRAEALRVVAGGDGDDGGIEPHLLRVHVYQLRVHVIARHELPLEIRSRRDVGYLVVARGVERGAAA